VPFERAAGFFLSRSGTSVDVCVFVHSIKTAPPSIPNFQRYGREIVLDVWLLAAFMVATALSVKAASHDKKDAASFEKIDKAIERSASTLRALRKFTLPQTRQKARPKRYLAVHG